MDIIKAIAGYIPVPEKEVEKLVAVATIRSLKKGTYFIRAGERPRKMAFVVSGLFRYVYIDAEGNEYTKAFMPESSFLSAYTAMVKGEGAYYFIEALEDSDILEFSYEDWLILKDSSIAWKNLLITMLEKGFGAKEQRERDLLLLDAETRYRNFCTNAPSLLARVKQHQIASFLGIKPESLSRLKKTYKP